MEMKMIESENIPIIETGIEENGEYVLQITFPVPLIEEIKRLAPIKDGKKLSMGDTLMQTGIINLLSDYLASKKTYHDLVKSISLLNISMASIYDDMINRAYEEMQRMAEKKNANQQVN